MTGPASGLVNHERLDAWLSGHGLGRGEPMTVEPLAGGSSNAMFVVHRGEQRWVLRRPAKVAIDKANEGMRREYRMLAALAGTDVPHPQVVALCEDHEVLGCTFYLMAHVDGYNPVPGRLPAEFDTSDGRAQVTYALVDALAAVHQVDWRGGGLDDLDRTPGFHERQTSRWISQLASYGGREMPGTDAIGGWLDQHRPAGFEPTIMHGDYHMMNVLLDPQTPARVSAILDWETSTIGDPLLDLAGFCEIWTPQTDVAQGWPSRERIVERYCERRALPAMPDLTYYEVLYNFRMTVLLEGIYQRSLHDSTRPVMESVGARAERFLARARQLIGDQ